MCGIAGLTGDREPDVLQVMLDVLTHRGPDDEGQDWIDAGQSGWIGLGSRRLAILDLSPAGHQPMGSGGDCLVYNGEIYNFIRLREELEASGESFKSGADTEVVLRLLQREGLRGLQRLNGMFALAFWNHRDRELLLARDRFGIKPLYYYAKDGRMAFASEAKALFAAGVPASIEVGSLGSYLSFGWVPGERTLYRNVLELAPGHVLRWRDGMITLERFRDAVPVPDLSLDESEATREVRSRLHDAVRRQLIADVPVGILLSGGLDSSAIAALASREGREVPTAYTIAFRDQDARTEHNPDDARFARLLANRYGIQLRQFVVAPSITDLLPGVAWYLDEPIADPAAILTLLICRAASKEVKVLLSGQGGDELFGGYRVHVFDRIAEEMTRLPAWAHGAGRHALRAFDAAAGRGFPEPALLGGLRRASHAILDNTGLPRAERFVGFRSAYYFHGELLNDLLTPEARKEALSDEPGHVMLQALEQLPDLDFFDRMLYADFKTYLAKQNLAYSDRMSMAASIEMRVPFLDDEVADFALTVPARLKLRRLHGKHVLRNAMEGIVPKEIIQRRKAGFAAPVRAWLRGELDPFVSEMLSDRWLAQTGLFEPSVVNRIRMEHRSGRRDHTFRIWTLLSFAMWHRAHLGGD